MTEPRPDFVRNASEIQQPESSRDLFATIARYGRKLGLTRLGINQGIVPPGCRTSTPHAHSLEEEFVFVVEGRPDLWLDGLIYPCLMMARPTGRAREPLGDPSADECVFRREPSPIQGVSPGRRPRAHR